MAIQIFLRQSQERTLETFSTEYVGVHVGVNFLA